MRTSEELALELHRNYVPRGNGRRILLFCAIIGCIIKHSGNINFILQSSWLQW